MENPFGEVVMSTDAAMLQPGGFEEAPGNILVASGGKGVADYVYRSTINGVPVAPEDTGLPIDSEEVLREAFNLDISPAFDVLMLSPEHQDDMEKYRAILAESSKGALVIDEELKQYDPQKGCYVVWLKYSRLCYRLGPRFAYLREEKE